MQTLVPAAAPELDGDAGRRSIWRRMADATFGYDFFISYKWTDGRTYALALCRELKRQGFEVFLDSEHYGQGDDWKKIGTWTLRRTGQLILVATPLALAAGEKE